jgi:hypothetical protein
MHCAIPEAQLMVIAANEAQIDGYFVYCGCNLF